MAGSFIGVSRSFLRYAALRAALVELLAIRLGCETTAAKSLVIRTNGKCIEAWAGLIQQFLSTINYSLLIIALHKAVRSLPPIISLPLIIFGEVLKEPETQISKA